MWVQRAGAQTSDQLGIGVLVDLGYVDDEASLLSVAQSAQALVHVARGRTQCCNHGRLRVATQTFLQ